jgi:hypothetical protein
MKTLKEYIINEGVFGYEPYDSDGFADSRYEIYNMIFDDITNRFKEVKDNYAPHLWDNIGLALYYTTILANSKEGLGNTDNFKAMDEQVLNAFSIIEKDEEWINCWKNPNKIIKNIAKAKTDWEKIKKKTY